ncbi:chitobiase/beta-hexosaminidase C-terminal domain-containing protein [Chryseobacterium sp. JV558]|uniref:chitobiase/beta-hexosaminidase C-terminal domain-containing protein n=1 Tax=Chryseobacterium sp. JV558 TaxID=2663236 RepID=UPI00299DC96F|nr:chitobiase/beta-hexosaminidase C-terminal domain-containing protein [Chryseobacterium sp. JV558]MDW9382457.1 T9SS type A sorting domain-containing protein [Chryseobacterium sp. JV558]
MKKFLLISSFLVSSFFFSQLTMSPFASHYDNPYQVTITGIGTIYYTTDGSTPTLSSSSAANSVQILIDQNKEIKAFLVNGQGNSSVVISKKYYTGTIPSAVIYFKAPSTWTGGSCVMVDRVNPNAVNGFAMDTFWPGITMQAAGCESWYKTTGEFENANLRFNNCTLFENIPQTISSNLIPAGSTLYYDFTNGIITTPPSCLFLVSHETMSKNKTVLIKVYPNPVSDILKVNTNLHFQEYEIIDGNGRIVSKNHFTKEITISHLVSGNYFLKLKDQQGSLVLLKFIKK